MARKASNQPTDGEMELLSILWSAGPSTLGEICAAVREKRNAATTTIATTLGVMRRKKLVHRTNGPRGYVWSAALDRGAAASGVIGKLIDRVFGGSAGALVSHLIDTGSLQEKDVSEIRTLMEEYKKSTRGSKGS